VLDYRRHGHTVTVMFRGSGSRRQSKTSPPFERPEGRFFFGHFTDFSDISTRPLDRDKANNIPRMHGGGFGFAWLKLQL
jgi:hypothetical protein